MPVDINNFALSGSMVQNSGIGGIITDGLVLHLDAGYKHSYPMGGTTWYDLTGNGYNYNIGGNLSFDSNTNTFTLSNNAGAGGGALNSSTLTTSTTCTLVFWIKTTDTQALFWGSDPPGYAGSFFVGAFRSGNKEYYGNCGTPDYYMDLTQPANIYDSIRDGLWHLVEFKNVNFSSWTNEHNFSSYNEYTFDNGSISKIMLYNKNLSSDESLQNYNATKERFGL